MMDEAQVQELLQDVLDEVTMDGELPELARAQSFEECGVLTMNKGLVLRMADGSEFQVEIVRSR
jgi:hypothetical protein